MDNRIKRVFVVVVAVMGLFTCRAITIADCYRMAQENYPLVKQYDLIRTSQEYNLSNAGKGWLPQLTLTAQATYQSEVTEIPVDFSKFGISGVNPPSRDQYGVALELNQTIWDGGAMKSQKDAVKTETAADEKSVEVSLYAIRERINQLYFGILLTDAQLVQNGLLKSELENVYSRVESCVNNGVANQSDLDAVSVERLRAEQNGVRLATVRKAYVEMLSRFVGKRLSDAEKFEIPTAAMPETDVINRPELELYDAQISNLQSKNSQITAGLMPKLGLFVRGGYGKPGLNMLNNSFKAYYMGGLKLSWNIGNFYSSRNNRQMIQNGIKSINTQRDVFMFNTDLDIMQKQNTVNTYREQLEYDDRIIGLRTSIRKSSEAKLAGGTISGTDLTNDINAEQTAIQDKIIHQMEMLLAIYNLHFTTNN